MDFGGLNIKRSGTACRAATEDGKLEISSLPIKKGQVVEVIVLPLEKDTVDFLSAAESSLDFWDNEIDDRIWNNI